MHEQLDILVKVAYAALLGGIIGFEREVAHKPAGMRTHMLVASLSAMIVLVGEYFIAHISADMVRPTGADPTRIIHAVITGISILGAGTIIRGLQSDKVEGLTTAASILYSGSVGIAVALKLYYIAGGATILALIILVFFRMIERFIGRKPANIRQEFK